MRVFKNLILWTLGAFAVGFAALALLMHLSARSALDNELQYSASVATLPVFSPTTTDGLVRISANNMEYRARIAGFTANVDGSTRPTVILLHGWPTTSAMWIPLIQPLVDAGYRVFAPDQRGYSVGARPEGRDNYTVDRLSADILALADEIGVDQFHLVGHDWGAVVGWQTVLTASERVISWNALSIAHPASFGAAVENDPDQAARSRYFMLFATPWLAESVFSMRDFALLKGAYGPFPEDTKAEFLAMFAEPGAMTAGFNWYRAMLVTAESGPSWNPEVTTPTLFVWGNQDGAVGRWATEDQARFMKGPYQIIEVEAGHWLLATDDGTVINAIVQHIQSQS